MKCTGLDAVSGEFIELEFERTITHADPAIGSEGWADFLAPGFIDLQVNGFAGADYNSPETSREQILASLRAMSSTGVTRCFPTVITGDPERMVGALRNLARARDSIAEGAAMEGFHVEGPHISRDDGPRGAHPARWVRRPDIDEFHRWQEATEGNVRIVTLSPEWDEAPGYIEKITAAGVVAAIGHTGATRQQILDAVAAGATLSTHLGNGKHAALTRESTYLWDQLAEDQLAASFIVDGLHLHDSFLKVALRAKGVERSVLVTDAVAPAMCRPGPYMLGEVEVELLPDDRVVMRGGQRLAGSSLRMDHAVSNVIARGGVTLADAVTMATRNPARVGRVAGRLRGFVPGERADVVRFLMEDGRVKVLETFVGGERVFPC